MFERNYSPYSTHPFLNGFSNIGGGGFLGMKKINWSSLLNNTQKTLNIINQAIPIVYQVKPIIANAKTMFKVISAVKEDDQPVEENNEIVTKEQKEKATNTNGPVFYV